MYQCITSKCELIFTGETSTTKKKRKNYFYEIASSIKVSNEIDPNVLNAPIRYPNMLSDEKQVDLRRIISELKSIYIQDASTFLRIVFLCTKLM